MVLKPCDLRNLWKQIESTVTSLKSLTINKRRRKSFIVSTWECLANQVIIIFLIAEWENKTFVMHRSGQLNRWEILLPLSKARSGFLPRQQKSFFVGKSPRNQLNIVSPNFCVATIEERWRIETLELDYRIDRRIEENRETEAVGDSEKFQDKLLWKVDEQSLLDWSS